MKGTDITEKQMRAAEHFILLLVNDKNESLEPSTIISQRWDSLVRLVALYGAIRSNGQAPAEEPGEVSITG